MSDKLNFLSLMKNAKKMQGMMEKAQAELAHMEITGEAGAGAVKIIMSAKFVVKSIHIDDEILKEEKQVLEELIAAAINDANRKVEELTKSKMMDFGNLMGSDFGSSNE